MLRGSEYMPKPATKHQDGLFATVNIRGLQSEKKTKSRKSLELISDHQIGEKSFGGAKFDGDILNDICESV